MAGGGDIYARGSGFNSDPGANVAYLTTSDITGSAVARRGSALTGKYFGELLFGNMWFSLL